MSLSCPEAHDRLEAYAAEALDSAGRRELREHLSDCRPCRGEAARCDPGLLFAVVRAEDVSAEDVARVLSGVRAGIALKQAERKLAGAPSHRRHRGLVAAAAAVVALALAFPGMAPQRSEPEAAAVKATISETPSERSLVPAAWPGAVPAEEIPNSKIPADATIYDWNPGGGKPRVVWIVDRSLDI